MTKSVVRAALPQALAPLGDELAALIAAELGPSNGRNIASTKFVRELDRLRRELSASRLAVAWERESNDACALNLLNAMIRSSPKNEIPWPLVARLRDRAGDGEGAHSATETAAAQPTDQQQTPLRHLNALTRRGEAGRTELERSVAQLRGSTPQSEAPAIGDEEQLYLAYINGRYLQCPGIAAVPGASLSGHLVSRAARAHCRAIGGGSPELDRGREELPGVSSDHSDAAEPGLRGRSLRLCLCRSARRHSAHSRCRQRLSA